MNTRRRTAIRCGLVWAGLLAARCGVAGADAPGGDDAPKTRVAACQALEEFNPLIGGWRGVGQPQRLSNRGSWSERGEWAWNFKARLPAIQYTVTEGKLLTSAVVTYDVMHGRYQFDAVLPDKSRRQYTGHKAGDRLIFEAEPDPAGLVHQIQITRLNDKRLLVLYQSRKAAQPQFARVAEVGYTREGTRLAVEGGGEPECIVTGGRGEMSLVYNGQTYYFCCTGCRDAFRDNPQGVLAEAAERARKRAASND